MSKSSNWSSDYKHPKWQKKKAEILDRDNHTCLLCGDTETQLHVHHGYYGKHDTKIWDVPDKYLWTLCENCHETVTEEMDRVRQLVGSVHPSKINNLKSLIKSANGEEEGTSKAEDGHCLKRSFYEQNDTDNSPRQKKSEIWTDADDRIIRAVSWRPDDQLCDHTSVANGNGVLRLYHQNGGIEEKIYLQDGVKHGPYESYYENGSTFVESSYEFGKPVFTTERDPNGYLLCLRRFDSEGLEHALQVEFYSHNPALDGDIVKSNRWYVHGLRHGPHLLWNYYGQLEGTYMFIEDKLVTDKADIVLKYLKSGHPNRRGASSLKTIFGPQPCCKELLNTKVDSPDDAPF